MSVLAEKLVLWFQVNFDPPLNDRGVLKVEDWAEICRLHRAEGMAIRAIARRPEISRNAVKKAVISHEPPRYVRAGAGSAVDGFEPQVRALLAEFPEMPTSVIMERVGWARGKTVSFERVAQLRPLFQSADPASRREYRPGNWRSVICGSRRRTYRWAGGRRPVRRCW
jgi:hypothetical protein